MQNILVKRYQHPGDWTGWIEPEDGSWIVFVAKDNRAVFYRRVECVVEDGKIESRYLDVEVPGILPGEDLPEMPPEPPQDA